MLQRWGPAAQAQLSGALRVRKWKEGGEWPISPPGSSQGPSLHLAPSSAPGSSFPLPEAPQSTQPLAQPLGYHRQYWAQWEGAQRSPGGAGPHPHQGTCPHTYITQRDLLLPPHTPAHCPGPEQWGCCLLINCIDFTFSCCLSKWQDKRLTN